MHTPAISASNPFDALLGKGAPSSAAGNAESSFNQLFTAQQLSLLGGQPQDFAAIQAQALAQFSKEQGQALSAESLLSEVALGDGEGLPQGGKALPLLQSLLAAQQAGIANDGNLEALDLDSEEAPPGLALAAMLAQLVAQKTQADTAIDADAVGERVMGAAPRVPLSKLVGNSGDAPVQGNLALGEPTGASTPTSMSEGFRQVLAQRSTDTKTDELVGAVSEKADSDVELASLMRELRSPPQAAQTKGPATFTVSQNALTDPGWSQAMTARVGWMMNNGIHTATVQLHPEELGSIQVQISFDGDSSRVQFHTQHAETGELVERMLPRLTHGFEQQGLRLDEVKVSLMNQQNPSGLAQGQSQGQNAAGQGGNSSNTRSSQQADIGAGLEGEVLRNVMLSRAGGVDDYA